MKNQGIWLVGLILLVVGLTFADTLLQLMTASWWFTTEGFVTVFWTRVTWQGGLWVGTFGLYVGILGLNYAWAQRATRSYRLMWLERSDLAPYADTLVQGSAIAAIGLIAIAAATSTATAWETLLQFLHPSEFGQTDPVFNQDVGFYFFRLPFYTLLHAWLLTLTSWSAVVAIALYLLKGAITVRPGGRWAMPPAVKLHLSGLIGKLTVLVAIGFWLQRFALLYSPTGVVYGAGYTDIHARLPAYSLMGPLTLALGAFLLLSLWRQHLWRLIYGSVLYLAIAIVLLGLYPALQQQLSVAPNELAKELPYIQANLDFTRAAYGLDQVIRQDYPATANLTAATLAQNQATIENIRLWDYRPLLSSYRQLQEIRAYYRFNDIDVDRYTLNGDYRQVMLSARELDTTQLSAQAQNWVNRRLKYTHGLGLAMSPVNQVTADGMPDFLIQDIPPQLAVDLPLTQAAIYYGELTRDYVITGATTDEFDYPAGNDNASNRYDGRGGVPIGSWGRRLAYALQFGDFKLLISNYLTSDSKLHYHRLVQDRIQRVAPFLRFDYDPYIAVIDGRLQWIIDAYTVSDRYPYAQPAVLSGAAATVLAQGDASQIVRGQVNYIRNSVKVVVDAYDGTMTFYSVDTTDPVLQTYRRIFPNLFQEQIPAAVQAQFRYPQNLFTIQALMYLAYHMDRPEVFYNQEDLWRFPTETYENNQQVTTEPYYVIMRLPNETAATEEFITILPFTPVNRSNMVAWLAARSDGDRYGELRLYEFPKQQLVYGPQQIEARIDQTPEISEQLTLWSQQGSSVIRGNLLVIPIAGSLLYIEPIYLRAVQGELPELKRVIVAHDTDIVMRETLAEALTTIFGAGAEPAVASPAVTRQPPDLGRDRPDPSSDDLQPLIQAAQTAFQNAENAQRAGDWAAYGRYQAELEQRLAELAQRSQMTPPPITEAN